MNTENIKDLVCGKRVLVTGAAGSIGSELCRQIMRHNPRHLILYDRNENGLFYMDRELGERYSRDFFSVVIGDICDMNRLSMKFKLHHPQIVFHAAAYKHVPLMEDNIVESVKNNVLGTWNLLELSDQFGVETFIQISTDKAVNPTSIMGVSKRIAEMAVKHMNPISRTRFIVVRFGNVLGSSGSVVPLFKEQIRKGGPVTVTHPDIQRYFMTIPEAVQLVLQAAYFGKGGERYKKISMAISTTNGKDTEEFFNQLIELQVSALGGDKDQIMEKIRELVPAYNPTVVESCQNGYTPGIIQPKTIDSINLSDYSASP